MHLHGSPRPHPPTRVADAGEINYKTYADFVQALRDAFGDPDEVTTAERETQGQFTRIMFKLDWNEATKVYIFR
jgi:hypothetical protein